MHSLTCHIPSAAPQHYLQTLHNSLAERDESVIGLIPCGPALLVDLSLCTGGRVQAVLCCKVLTFCCFIRCLSSSPAAVWCREKMLLLGSTDYGQEMTGAQKLKKKHQRLENELESHEDKIRVGMLL